MKVKKTSQAITTGKNLKVSRSRSRSSMSNLRQAKMEVLRGMVDYDKDDSNYEITIDNEGDLIQINKNAFDRLLKNERIADMQMDSFMALMALVYKFGYLSPLLTAHWIQGIQVGRSSGFTRKKYQDNREHVLNLAFKNQKGLVMIVHDENSKDHW